MVTVAGCEPACEHEWTDGPTKTQQPQRDHAADGSFGDSRGNENSRQGMAYKTTQGAYCAKCGGWRGDLGLEPTVEAYIGHLILCLREWRRILRDDGTCWVNLGDSFYGGKGTNGNSKARRTANERGYKQSEGTVLMDTRPLDTPQVGLKPKDLVGIPWRFAFAAQADGWYLRSAIVGAKVAPMPESIRDRPTKSYEHIFLLAKSQTYYYDAEAVRERSVDPEGSAKRYESAFFVGPKHESGSYSANGATHTAGMKQFDGGRNLRDVWEWRPQPFPGAHFAVWPEAIPERCIKAGSSARGACPNCGSPWRRVVEKGESSWQARKSVGHKTSGYHAEDGAISSFPVYDKDLRPEDIPHQGGFGWVASSTTTGWEPTCSCAPAEPVPCVVCDPFSGSGTTGVVAVRLGRAYVGVDISQEYLDGVTNERVGGGLQIGIGL
jgi:DNA modification methylase